ncbi:kelch-like protein 2 [Saccoglossus kowalevskii]
MGMRLADSYWFPSDNKYACNGLPGLQKDLEKLMNDKTTADVVFVVGNEEVLYYAHKLILNARCQLFHDFLHSNNDDDVTRLPLPDLDPELFGDVLYFIYTGKIQMKDCNVFELLSVSQLLGIEHLQSLCHGYIIDGLTNHNACHFLTKAMQMSSSQHNTEFSLNEDDVWRCVLSWAKRQANVNKDTIEWSDEDRKKVGQQLSGVINHVKLLLIDSSVFAEEVEPTGAVPMELSLQRYRIAAMPTQFDSTEDLYLMPRVCNRFFYGTKLLNDDKLKYQRDLNNWYGNPIVEWRLLYRASMNGYSADNFHDHCDGFSPTYIIIQGNDGCICGGFTDIPWSSGDGSRGKYFASERTYLFSLVNTEGIPPVKYKINNNKLAVCHHARYGPIFGGGADLCISSNCHTNKQSYSNFPHSYGKHDNNPVANILMGEYHFLVQDYEVFTNKQTFQEQPQE